MNCSKFKVQAQHSYFFSPHSSGPELERDLLLCQNGLEEKKVFLMEEYILDYAFVQGIIIALYTIVFLACFFGNLCVILVATLHWRLRTKTNFCIVALSCSDLCIGIFCIFQNLSVYLIKSWVFGSLFCKIYNFTDRFCYTISIMILVMISLERYLAIISPIKCREYLSLSRLKIGIFFIWLISFLINSPRLYYFKTVDHSYNDTATGQYVNEIICLADQTIFNHRIYDLIIFIVLYIVPLSIIVTLYAKIGFMLQKRRSPGTVQSNNNSVAEGNSSQYQQYQYQNNHISTIHSPPPVPHNTELHSSNSTTADSSIYPDFNGQGQKYLYQYRNKPSSVSVDDEDGDGEVFVVKPEEEIVVVNFDRSRLFKRNQKYSLENNDIVLIDKIAGSSGFNLNKVSGGEEGSSRDSGRSSSVVPLGDKEISQDQESASYNSNGNNNNLRPEEENIKYPSYASPSVSEDANNEDEGLKMETLKQLQNQNDAQFCSNLLDPPSNSSQIKRIRIKKLKVTVNSSNKQDSHRRVLYLLICLVSTFAICNLPFHLRKIWQHFISSNSVSSSPTFSMLFTIVTHIFMYSNSALHPLLYSFYSKKFRLCFVELFTCKLKRSVRFSLRRKHSSPI